MLVKRKKQVLSLCWIVGVIIGRQRVFGRQRIQPVKCYTTFLKKYKTWEISYQLATLHFLNAKSYSASYIF